MNFKIKSKFGEYEVKNVKKIDFKNEKNHFYLVDKKIYKKNLIKKIKKNLVLLNVNENLKNYYEIGKIINKLIKINIRKNSTIVAVGGGITQDVAGFISSILFRGVKWHYYPTTILSQGDSCIGSKTSINFARAKNQLGNFYPPNKIFIYKKFLRYLKKDDIFSGLGELLHYFLISNSKDWALYKNNLKKYLLNKDRLENIEQLINRSLIIKKKFIEKDEMERGVRILLNYGHSFGHAIEKTSKYKIAHGMAVAHGINIANFFSLKLRLMERKRFNEIENIITQIINLKQISMLNQNHLLEALKKDKKNVGKSFRFILSKDIGKTFIKKINNHKKVKKYLKDYMNYILSK
ncbi:MAG: 3-dehydroquinate synthase [Candidatus Marinimicrobia bacterium]|nr:3-dehydroquinate synthase [Candidatus Neomarinimicrobiota bacterium]